jgi:hypothetical protein
MELVGYDAKGTETAVEALYRHRGRMIRVAANQGNLPAQLTAAYAAIGLGETAQTYAEVFLANRAKIFDAISTFGDGWRNLYVDDTTAPTTAQMRTVLQATLTIILTMDTPIVRELTVERLALLLPGAPTSAWTIGECRNWLALLSGWLGRAQALLASAMVAGSTD